MTGSKLLGAAVVAFSMTAMVGLASAEDQDSAIASCLRAWTVHPFAARLAYRTLAMLVKVFGIGKPSGDFLHTEVPALVLVNPGVNVMGRTTIDLMNPNGWYCFRSMVNVMGDVHVRADCGAHVASAQDGVAVLASDQNNDGVTVLGRTQIEFVACR